METKENLEESFTIGGLTPEQTKLAIEHLGIDGLNAVVSKVNEIIGDVVSNMAGDLKITTKIREET